MGFDISSLAFTTNGPDEYGRREYISSIKIEAHSNRVIKKRKQDNEE
jgi:hypothetical protein